MRKHIEYEYLTCNGVTLHHTQVDRYNAIQDRINSFISEGLQIPEYLLFDSFNIINYIP